MIILIRIWYAGRGLGWIKEKLSSTVLGWLKEKVFRVNVTVRKKLTFIAQNQKFYF